MDKQINYTLMRTRIDFLYRLLNYTNAVTQRQMGLKEEEAGSITDLVSTVGFNLIWIGRINTGEPITTPASIAARGICQVLADEFIKLAEQLRQECSALPVNVRIEERSEEILQAGFDHIIEVVKNLVEGKTGLFPKEVSND